MKQEQIIECGGQKIKVFNCDPEKNTQCDKEFCVGDSMDSVSNAVITVKKNLKDLDETTLTHLTEQAITLDELYGIDMNETLRGVKFLRKL